MKKKINIILTKDYINIGKKGKLVDVSAGYALNYLIPNKIAEIATSNKIKHLKMFEEIKNKQKKVNEINHNKIKKQLESIKKISINRKPGENNYIFGRITEKDISTHIFKYIHVKLDKKQIIMSNPKQLGAFDTHIQISTKMYLKLKLNILPVNI